MQIIVSFELHPDGNFQSCVKLSLSSCLFGAECKLEPSRSVVKSWHIERQRQSYFIIYNISMNVDYLIRLLITYLAIVLRQA